MSASLNVAPSISPLSHPSPGPTFPHLPPQMYVFSGFGFSEPNRGYEGRIRGKLTEPFLHPKKGSNHLWSLWFNNFYHDMLWLTSPNFGALALNTKGSSKLCSGQLVLSYLLRKSDRSSTRVACIPLSDALYIGEINPSLSPQDKYYNFI